ncbi:MAG: hypothetical protein ACOZHQ_11805 [Thermodesulfobacteriota bacterium]
MNELWWLLLAADALLVAAVAALLWRLRRGRGPAVGQPPPDLAGFLAEADRLAKEFDRLLAEKRELVATTLNGIDRRLAELNALARELDQRPARASAPPAAAEPPVAPAPADPADPAAFRRRVLLLARQGQDARQIAAATGRPQGEVDLVLGLSAQGREP